MAKSIYELLGLRRSKPADRDRDEDTSSETEENEDLSDEADEEADDSADGGDTKTATEQESTRTEAPSVNYRSLLKKATDAAQEGNYLEVVDALLEMGYDMTEAISIARELPGFGQDNESQAGVASEDDEDEDMEDSDEEQEEDEEEDDTVMTQPSRQSGKRRRSSEEHVPQWTQAWLRQEFERSLDELKKETQIIDRYRKAVETREKDEKTRKEAVEAITQAIDRDLRLHAKQAIEQYINQFGMKAFQENPIGVIQMALQQTKDHVQKNARVLYGDPNAIGVATGQPDPAREFLDSFEKDKAAMKPPKDGTEARDQFVKAMTASIMKDAVTGDSEGKM